MEMMPLASRLTGKRIGRWTTLEKREKTEEDNSGFFSCCYVVEDDHGRRAFLKAFDYHYAFRDDESADILKRMLENFTYERDLLKLCGEKGMKRIVRAVDSGEYKETGEVLPVPYLVFEIADSNLKAMQNTQSSPLSFKLEMFHGALVGLAQLHTQHIAHQDIKPSNVLIFGQNYAKIADLGSATQLNNESNWNKPLHQGDMRFAPIELLYGYCSPDWATRRFGADLFMMGGLLCYLLTGVNFLFLMLSKIPPNRSWSEFTGSYSDIEPDLMNAYYESIGDIQIGISKKVDLELIAILSELTHPIPEERGNPSPFKERIGQFSLQRYISKAHWASGEARIYRK